MDRRATSLRWQGVKFAVWILVFIQLVANIGILFALWLANVQLVHVKRELSDIYNVDASTQESVDGIKDKTLKLECSYEPQVYGTIVSSERKLVCNEAD